MNRCIDRFIEALKCGETPKFSELAEQYVYHIGRELYETRRVSQATYDNAVNAFGESAVVELIGIFGYYALVAMTLNVFEVRRDTSVPLPFNEP